MIEISFQYKALFRVSFEHPFFEDNSLTGFSFIPTVETIQFLNQNKLLIKKLNNGFDVLVDVESNELFRSKIVHLLGKGKKLAFAIFIKDSNFKNYTNIPFDTNNKILYFSNSNLKNKKEGILHKESYVSASDLYNLNVKGFAGEDNLSLEQIGTNNNTYQLSNDIIPLNLPNGAYRVLSGKKTIAEFVNFKDNIKGLPLAVVELELNDTIIKEIEDVLSDNEFPSFSYKIIFQARAIKWRYTIVPIYMKRTNGLKIVPLLKGSKIKFQEKKIAGKEEHIVFESNKEMDFKQFYEEGFQLKKGNSESDGKTLVKKLPYPALDFIKPLEKDEYYSDILVYI